MIQTKTQQLNPQIFTIWSDEIKGRIDPSFYRPDVLGLLKQAMEAGNKNFCSLRDLIVEMSGGATPKVTGDFYLENGGVPFLRVQNITEEGIKLNDVKFIKKEAHEKELKRSQLKKDDIVFTITGRIGSAAVVPDNFEGNISQHSVRFHLKDKINGIRILPEYVAIFFNTDMGRKLSFRGVSGGTRPALDYKALKSLEIPIPPLKIQSQIVSIMQKAYSEKREKEGEAKEILDSIDDYMGIPESKIMFFDTSVSYLKPLYTCRKDGDQIGKVIERNLCSFFILVYGGIAF